jgi:ABC1 atypical kinase-like domain
MEELDYLTEAANADRFRTEMAKSEALGEAIIVPRVHHALTDRYVLVTGTVQQHHCCNICHNMRNCSCCCNSTIVYARVREISVRLQCKMQCNTRASVSSHILTLTRILLLSLCDCTAFYWHCFCMHAEWVEGVKVSSIDVTTPEGRSKLATLQATLLNSYLTQLLESGFLHAGTLLIVYAYIYIYHIVKKTTT